MNGVKVGGKPVVARRDRREGGRLSSSVFDSFARRRMIFALCSPGLSCLGGEGLVSVGWKWQTMRERESSLRYSVPALFAMCRSWRSRGGVVFFAATSDMKRRKRRRHGEEKGAMAWRGGDAHRGTANELVVAWRGVAANRGVATDA